MERMWHKKSRVNWYLKGDINTKFFHIMASSRQRRNCLNFITVLDETILDPPLIKQADFNHFKKLYRNLLDIIPSFLERIGNEIYPELAQSLVAEFEIQEVWEAIKSSDGI